MRFIVALLMSWAFCAAAEVTVYRVVDAEGRVSFSDRPPPGTDAQELQVEVSAPPPSPEVAERQAAMRELSAKLREDRIARDAASAPADSGTPLYYPAYPPPTERVVEERWLPIYYPGYAPRPPWHRPPPRPTPLPQPNPDSLSPRGLEQRLKNAR